MRKTKTMWKTAGCLVVLGLAASIGTAAAAGGDLRLVHAAKKGDRDAVRALLKQAADVGAAEGDGTTALHWVAYRDDAESAALLIRAGARVNVANDLGATPLWAACENGSAAMVRTLLDAGANPNMALRSGETPLMTAARTGNAEVVRQLIAKGADVNAKERAHDQTALMWAVAQQHPAVVEVLLAHGADLRARSNVRTEVVKTAAQDERNPDYTIDIQQGGYTPLLFAARVGDLASARHLVAAGAEVNDTAPYGTSALVVAAHSGHGKLAAFLLEKGADPNAVGAGYAALHAAILHKDEALVAALLAHGANPNIPVQRATPTRRDSADFYLPPASVGATPFWLAARYKAPGVMRLLARHGADPLVVHRVAYWSGGGGGGGDDDGPGAGRSRSLIDEGGITALMAAAGMGGKSWTSVANVGDDGPLFAVNRLDRIAEEAEAGANRSPDLVEVEAATLEAVKIAAELGVNVNAANADADTALHAAAVRGFDSVVKFLVERGARLDARNKKGQTPLAAAVASSGRRSRYQDASPTKRTLELLRGLEATQ